jgi:hypothetical protein
MLLLASDSLHHSNIPWIQLNLSELFGNIYIMYLLRWFDCELTCTLGKSQLSSPFLCHSVHLQLSWVCPHSLAKCLLVSTDNEEHWCSPYTNTLRKPQNVFNRYINDSIYRTNSILLLYDLLITFIYVESLSNLADPISRGLLPPLLLIFLYSHPFCHPYPCYSSLYNSCHHPHPIIPHCPLNAKKISEIYWENFVLLDLNCIHRPSFSHK